MPRSRSLSRSPSNSVFAAPSEGWFVLAAGAVVGLASWALGGKAAWAQTWLLALAAASFPLMMLRFQETRQIPLRPLLPFALWLAFGATAILNPSHASALGGGWVARSDWIRWLPTTVDVAHTLADLQFWSFALVLGAAATALVRGGPAVRFLWGLIALNGLVLAIVGACFRFTGATQVLGFVEAPEPTYFFATFFYKNHWAAFGALSAAAGLTLALQAWPAALRGHPDARGRVFLFGAAGLLTAVTLPLPGSRAGVLFALTLLATFAVAMAVVAWRARRLGGWLGLASAALATGIVAYGAAAYATTAKTDLARTRAQIARNFEGEALDLRVLVSRDTWHMAQQRPVFGWGPGAFEIVFPVFQGSYLREPNGRSYARFEYAHNDWLQTLAEDGPIGTAILLLPAGVVGWRAWRRAGLAGRWGIFGCALVALHAWIDFPLHNLATLIVWTLLLTTAGRLGSDTEAEAHD